MPTAQANDAPSAARRARPMGMLSAAAVLLLVIAAGSLGWAVWQLRADARRDAFEETGNLAVVLAGQHDGEIAGFLEGIAPRIGAQLPHRPTERPGRNDEQQNGGRR